MNAKSKKEVVASKLPSSMMMSTGASQVVKDELDAESYAVPRLSIIEKMSPQVDETEPEYIEGAKPGMVFNSVTQELFDGTTGLKVIPCLRRHVFIEWVLRENGGGFVGTYSAAEGKKLRATTTRNEKNLDILPNGNELRETFEFYVLASADGKDWNPAIISMSRTRAKEAKNWNYRIDNRVIGSQPVLPQAQVFDLQTAIRKGSEGNSFVWKTGPSMLVTEIGHPDPEGLFNMAVDFGKQVASGEKGAVYEEEQSTSSQREEEEF